MRRLSQNYGFGDENVRKCEKCKNLLLFEKCKNVRETSDVYAENRTKIAHKRHKNTNDHNLHKLKHSYL